MTKNKFSVLERAPFLMIVTFLGGYLDAYTFITRGGVFANNHTGNVAKLGVTLAQGNFIEAINCFVPILACVFGAVAAEYVRVKTKSKTEGEDWRIRALYFQCAVLFIIGFVPQMFPDVFVNTTISFITGYQICLFRVWEGSAHNTTICTGNLRNIGQLLFGALNQKDIQAYKKFFRYIFVVFSFTFGAAIGTIMCKPFGTSAVWLGCILIICMIIVIKKV